MRHRVVDLDGPVHFLDFGGTGDPILLVHGLGGSALNWMAVGPRLTERHRVLAIDLAGFGQTPLFHRSAAVGANSNLVHEFTEKVVGEPVILVGNSMGGHIGILEASDHPDWVASLVLVDPAVPGMRVRAPDPALLAMAATVSIPGLGEAVLDRRFRQLGPERLVERVLRLVCADPSKVDPAVVAAHVELTRERGHVGPQGTRAFVQASRSLAVRMADPRFWARVRFVQAPTLVIHGSLDRLIPLAAARDLKQRRPDWTLEVLEGVGHVPMMETPDRFIPVLDNWLRYRITLKPAMVS